MGTSQGDRLDEQFYRDENWIVNFGGGFIHSNNVLFYFMQSPFFDRTSNNSSLWVQSVNTNDVANTLGTREAFEGRLRTMQGLEFVVAHDPLQSSAQIPTTDGGTDWSNVWVIKKQDRRKRPGSPDEVTVLAYYYIVNNAIYMAPSVGKVVGNRMLSAITSLDKMLSAASPLPLFSSARGYTYLPPTAKSTNVIATSTRASKENTPMPEVPNAVLSKAAKVAVANAADQRKKDTTIQDLRTLTESFGLSFRYGKEYMDETPLTGEPGNFILSKSKDSDTLQPPTRASGQLTGRSPFQAATKEKQSPGQPKPPPIQTDVPVAASRKSGNKSVTSTPISTKDRKRRKSKHVTTPGE